MNNIELITKFATEAWDKVYKKESISSILDGEKDLMKFTGVKTVKIAKHSSDGLGFYQRANKTPASGDEGYGQDFAALSAGTLGGYGYPTGDVDLVWEEFTIKIDRARQLRIELFDNEESGELAVTAALTDFSRTKVAPEVDAYVFSKLVDYAATVDTTPVSLVAGTDGMGYQAAGPIQLLNNAFTALEEEEVPEEDQVVFASVSFINKLRSSGEVIKVLHQNEYKENVNFSVYEYMGREIIAVPGRRFRTNIQLTQNGFSWGEGNQAIDFIVCAKSAVYHVTKYDKIRVFEPKMVQDFDGYKVNVRVYHDVFVPDNKRVAIYAHTSNVSAVAPTIKFLSSLELATTTASLRLSSVAVIPGDLMIDGLYLVPSASATIGSALTDISGEIQVYPYAENVIDRPASNASDVAYKLCGVKGGSIIAVSSDSITITKQAG